MKSEILLVDDDRQLVKSLAVVLEEAGYSVRIAPNGAKAIQAVRQKSPDLVLLDVMMPGKNGFDICEDLREIDAKLPIAFLSALDRPEDEVRGLGSGADLYISKTAPDNVLLARIAALLRPRERIDDAVGDFSFGSWFVMPKDLVARAPLGRTVSLTERELYLLRLFSRCPGEVLTRETLLTRLWPHENIAQPDNALSVLVYSLRKKLGRSADAINVVRGIGYAYRP